MVDDNATAAARFSIGKRFGNWKIVKKIDEGGFGQVYKVENVVTKKIAALKAEPTEIEGGSALKLEMAVIRAITADGEKPHVPMVFHAAKRRRFCYMIMTLFGENLKELRMHCPKEFMSARTWSRIGIQCLYSVKLVHDYGFVHRDIKPNNFVMGYREDYDRARIVHILDFGLSRSYAVQKEEKWVARRARGTAEFRGTLRYCSPNVHERKEQGRRDDLWSLYYVLIELHCGLPWQTIRDKQKVELVKMNISDKDLVLNFPVELHDIIPYLRTLDYYQRPNYSMFYNGLVAVMKRVGAKASDPYDWEKPDAVNYIQQHVKDPYAWENAAGFFQSDPIKVNSPPPGKSRRRKLSNLSKLISVDTNTKKLTSQATSTSTDAEKANIPSEQTLREMQEKLSMLYGVKEESSSRQKKVLKGFLGTNLPPLESKPVNKEKRNEREREKEIKQQLRKDDLNEVAKEAKLKMRLDERRKDPKKQETIMKTQNATIGSKEPMVERKAPGKKQKATVEKKKRNA